MTLAVFLAGCIVGGMLGAIAMALLAAAGDSDDKRDLIIELDTVRKQLAACQQASLSNQERADYYYELFCDGAQANAALRRQQCQPE